MALRVLAILAEAEGSRACLDGAWAAASIDPDASVEALHVKVDPDHLIRAPEEIALQHMREREEGTAEQRAKAVRDVFESWITRRSADERRRVTWRELVGAEEETVLKESRDADLLVLAQPHHLDGGDARHAAIFHAHRPLLIPPEWSVKGPATFGEKIVIGWTATPQARRAVLQAEPWLRRARQVCVVCVTPPGGDPATEEISRTLTQMRAAFGVFIEPADSRDPAEILLESVRKLGADALVIGAYRHNEWVEWALGRTTNILLREARIPLFLAH